MTTEAQPASLARYSLLRALGRGPSTQVDLVYDEIRKLTLARKRWEHASAEMRFRLRQQYRRALTVRHPNLVQLFDLTTDAEDTCLTMEAVLGTEVREYVRTLREADARSQTLLPEIVRLLHQLADALATLHTTGIVHRDIKPANLWVEPEGRLVLLDAGFAWPRENDFAPLDESTLQGTIPYLAPECLRGALPSVEADWYSFGAVAAELLTGQPLFTGTLAAIQRAKDLTSFNLGGYAVGIPEALDALVSDLLHRDPKARPDVADVLGTLRALRDDYAAQAESAPPPADDPAGSQGDQQPMAAEVAVQAEETLLAGEAPAPTVSYVADLTEGRAAEPLPCEVSASTVVEEAQDLVPPTADEPVPADAPSEAEPAFENASPASEAAVQLLPPSAANVPENLQRELEAPKLTQPLAATEANVPVPTLESATSEAQPSEADTAQSGVRWIETRQPSALAPAAVAQPEPQQPDASQPTAAPPATPAIVRPDTRSESTRERTKPLAQLEAILRAQPRTSVVTVHVSSGATQAALQQSLLEAARAAGSATLLATCQPEGGGCYPTFTALVQQLARSREWTSSRLPITLQTPALLCLFPELTAVFEARRADTPAAPTEPQRCLVEALQAFQGLWGELSRARRWVVLLDRLEHLDRDDERLLRALLQASPRAPITWVLMHGADPSDGVATLLTQLEAEAEVAVLRSNLEPSAANGNAATKLVAEARSAPAQAADDNTLAHTLRAAQAASAGLALERAADLYAHAVRLCAKPDVELLEATALAEARAGRLELAGRRYLYLARCHADLEQAQRCERIAASLLLRAGNAREGRELLQTTLRAVGTRLPRAPLLTGALERARLLLTGRRRHTLAAAQAETVRRRFDTLWGAARELILIEPTAADALSVRALRDALALGDNSRLVWSLGYEAASEANIGGTYMRRRANTLEAQASQLAAHSCHSFDTAYVRSVQGIVAWFAGDWATAERLLRAALQLYAAEPESTAYERHMVANFLLGALEAQGDVHALNALLPALRSEAELTGYVHASFMCTLADAGLPSLARDRPLAAIAAANTALGRFGDERDFAPQHFQHLLVTVAARLYAGHVPQAFGQIERAFSQFGRGYFLHLDAVAVMLHQLRGRSALALAQNSPAREAERLRKLAASEAEAIGDSGLGHAQALQHLLQVGVNSLAGRDRQAREHCEQARSSFEQAGMRMMRELAGLAVAGLTDDPVQAKRLAHESAGKLRELGVVNPRAMMLAWFPTLASTR